LLLWGAYKFNICYEPFLKIAAPLPPVAQADPVAAQKTPRLTHLHLWLRGNVGAHPYIHNIYINRQTSGILKTTCSYSGGMKTCKFAINLHIIFFHGHNTFSYILLTWDSTNTYCFLYSFLFTWTNVQPHIGCNLGSVVLSYSCFCCKVLQNM
jgi:hypothetical protein